MMLDGTQSFFINDELISDANERCLVHDIHPTGPLWGEEPFAPVQSSYNGSGPILGNCLCVLVY